jgi:outer membrane protein assembly factor BamA
VTTIYVHGNINYDFYGIGVEPGSGGRGVPLKQNGQVFLGEFLRRLKWRFFIGPRVLAGNSTITLRSEPAETLGAPAPPDVGLDTRLTGLGFRVNRDTRINRFYPDQGSYVDLTSMFFSEVLGSKYTYEPLKFTVNRYWGLTGKQVLAYNLYACATWSEPPFYGECIYGANNELRGYVGGKHIDRYMLATQAEYRLVLPWRLGMTAFGGVGGVAPSVSEFRYRNLLPGGGVGLRFKLSKKYGVNLRGDFAQGRDGHTFIMGIGEAF